jgi:branched-chain amino acid transport system permease protein
MASASQFDLRDPIRFGLLAGAASLGLSAIGMVELFGERDLIFGVVTLGLVLVFAAPVILAFFAASKAPQGRWIQSILYATISGLLASLPLVGLILLAANFDIRQFLINVSPALIELLTFGEGVSLGTPVLVGVMVAASLLAGVFKLLPQHWQRPLLWGLVGTLTIGLFSEILTDRLRSFFGTGFVRLVFRSAALKPLTAALLFMLIAGASVLWRSRGEGVRGRVESLPPRRRQALRVGSIAAGIILLLILPALLGTYLSEVINNVGLYVLMGLGLNIVVGFAGLLDLGYVAFFAIGAYTMGVLTSQGQLGLGFNFWTALPICVAVACLAGVILGLPVLRMRGDYLAIVTLGFGEIIRILALSDMLKPYIGGAQGVLQIPKPSVAGLSLVKPEYLYFVVLAGMLLAWYVSWRLSESRLGRQWMAVREDEDVGEAMGINLVKTKLLAFAIGASFSGLSGAIFASKLTSIFPHSFSLLVSINVLCLIIVGGMGSLPGVAVGALILVGLPELLREFAEYRLLMYGALLIVMMLARPEGFWPSAVHKRELRASEEQYEAAEAGKRSEAITVEAGD